MEDTIKLEAQQDFLEKIANAKPEIALAEIIWNSFDADASRVDVRFIGDEINVNEIQIEDNGSGIPFDKIKTYFSSLGGSWKVNSRKTATGRIIHGKNGQGRLKCFALGEYVEWHIHSQEKKYGVKAQYGTFKNFKIFDQPDPIGNTTGVLVKIIHPHKQWQIFSSDIAKAKLCPIFGYYLSMYPNITIAIQGDKINIEELIENRKDIEIASVQYGNENYKIDIQIIEWCSSANGREMYFCSAEGFPIAKIDKQIRGISDFSFVAYVKSNLFELDDVKNLLEIQEMDKELSKIVDTITRSVKLHFIERKISMSSKNRA